MNKLLVIKSKGKVLQLDKQTIIMGVLNITPDSFSDGGEYFSNKKAVLHAKQMLHDGADIIDIGGESTRPDAEKVSVEEELRRIIPVIHVLREQSGNSFFISIDTYKAKVARAAITAGADIVNDVSGLQMDTNMPKVIAESGVPVIINHMRGTPQTMQKGKIVYKDVVQDILAFFQEKVALLDKHGVAKSNIIIDPGFGFGKTVAHNLEILKRFREFTHLGMSTLIGLSRKSTFGIVLQEAFGTDEPFPSSNRLEASLAATAVAVLNGANIIRTHDVLPTKKFLAVIDKIKSNI